MTSAIAPRSKALHGEISRFVFPGHPVAVVSQTKDMLLYGRSGELVPVQCKRDEKISVPSWMYLDRRSPDSHSNYEVHGKQVENVVATFSYEIG